MWPWFNSQTWHHVGWVCCCCFFFGGGGGGGKEGLLYSGFSLSSKTNIPNLRVTGLSVLTDLCYVSPSLNKVDIFHFQLVAFSCCFPVLKHKHKRYQHY